MQLANYRVQFTHQNKTNQKEHYVTTTVVNPETKESIEVMLLVRPEPSFTECRIFEEPEGINAQVGIGVGILANGDNFCKEQGRKYSLKRAMDSAGFDKATRTTMWEAYRNSTPEGRWKAKEAKTSKIVEQKI